MPVNCNSSNRFINIVIDIFFWWRFSYMFQNVRMKPSYIYYMLSWEWSINLIEKYARQTYFMRHGIDLLHRSHNAPIPYPTMHHFVTKMCTYLLQNAASWDTCLMYCRICEMSSFNSHVCRIDYCQVLVWSVMTSNWMQHEGCNIFIFYGAVNEIIIICYSISYL